MNSEKDNNQIIQYLLGTLSDDKTEYFDELSFTDDEFAEKLKDAENELIDKYIQHELDDATMKRFESYYLASPIRREKLKFAEALQFYAKQNVKNTEVEKIGFLAILSNFFSLHKLQFGFAAVILLLLVLSGLWIFTKRPNQHEVVQQKTPAPIETPLKNENINSQNQTTSAVNNNENTFSNIKPENKNTTPTPKPTVPALSPTTTPVEVKPIIASIVLSPPVRGGNKIQVLLVTAKTDRVAVRLQMEADDYKTYSISLLDPSNKSILQSGKIKAQGNVSNRFLSLSFPAKLLADGFYTLSVSGIKDDGMAEILADYPFRAVLK